jgi:6-pyruvoyltetrahydropterin/6-carboxytetrahydropterin synthase
VIALERSYSFAASHLYRRPDWSDERNFATFGKCSIPPAHGHNYRLTLRVSGEVDPSTGFVVDLPALDRLVREAIVDRLDHRHVNEAVERFAPGREIPTTEALVAWMVEELGPRLPSGTRLVELRLAEDDRLASVWLPNPALSAARP